MSNSAVDRSKTSQLQDTPDPYATPVEVAALNHQRFHAAFDQAPIGIAYVGWDGCWLEMNRRCREILGLSQADLSQHTLHTLIQPGDHRTQEVLQRLRADPCHPCNLEQLHRRKDGSRVWISLRLSTVHSATGEPDFLLCMIEDITERKQAEAREQRCHMLLDRMPQIVWTATPAGIVDCFNQRWYAYTGLSMKQSLDAGWQLAVHPQDLQAYLDGWIEAIRTGTTYEGAYRLRGSADSAYRWHLVRALPLYDHTGAITQWLGTCTDIDDQKRAENALRASEERLNIIARTINDAIWDWDLVANEVIWNETAALVFGYHGDAVRLDAVWWTDRIHPEDRERVSAGIRAAIDDHQQSWSDEYRFRRADSSYAYVLDRAYVIYDQTGQAVRMIGAMTDFSKRREAEALTSGQKRILEMIALGAALPMVLDALARLIESQSEDMICAILLLDESGEYLTYGAGPSLPEGYQRAAERIPISSKLEDSESSTVLREPMIITDIATDLRWAAFADLTVDYDVRACWSTPIISSLGQVLGTVAMYYREPRQPAPSDYQLIQIATHISGIAIERERTASALENALQRLNFHVENTPLGMVEWNQNFRAMRWSQGAERIFGWKAEEVLGKSPHEWHFVHVDDVEVVANAIARLLGGGERRSVTLNRNYTKDGRVIHCVWYCSALLDSAGQTVSVLALVEDVTTRLQAEESLRFLSEATALLASSLDYEKTLSTLAQLVVPRQADWCSIDLIDDNGSIQSLVLAHKDPNKVTAVRELNQRYPFNPNAGYGLARVLRTGKAEFMAEIPDDVLVRMARSDEHLQMLRAAGLTSYMMVPLIARKRILGVLSLISAESGRRYDTADLAMAEHLARRAAIAVDNSRLYRELQEAIIARDEFLSIASHELKTPITALQLQAQSLLRNAKKGMLTSDTADRMLTKLELINQQTDRLTKLANDLLDVARIRAGRIELRLEAIDLAQTVRDVVLRFEDQFDAAGSSIMVRTELGAMINADRMRLEQVVTNLLSNALKYGGGKPIEIAVETDTATARLIVRDHGIGIAPEQLERIFVRFERAVSSRHYGGLGLGLYITRQIVEALHGSIHVSSDVGIGSTFVVILPLAHIKQSAAVDRAESRNTTPKG